MSDNFLHMQDVSFAYPGQSPVVRDVTWSLPFGGFHCLLGRSGCGKSTLLKLAAGLILPHSGQVRFDGQEVRSPGPLTGFVFQSPTLLEWLTVLDNVLLPVALKRQPDAADRSRACAVLEELGLAGMENRYPRQLSGGQQSRVAIARVLLTRPRLLLMDEPFAALDALTREELQDVLLAVCRQHGMSALFVTHDIAEAVYLSNRIAVMNAGSIIHSRPVDFGVERSPALRHTALFNTYCADLRRVMDATRQGQGKEVAA